MTEMSTESINVIFPETAKLARMRDAATLKKALAEPHNIYNDVKPVQEHFALMGSDTYYDVYALESETIYFVTTRNGQQYDHEFICLDPWQRVKTITVEEIDNIINLHKATELLGMLK